jgi:hypothetical protein
MNRTTTLLKRSLLVLALMVFIVPFISSAAQIANLNVEDKEDFVLEPGKIEVYADPGQTIVKNISVTSRIKQRTKFKVTTEDFLGSRSESEPVVLLGDQKSPYSFKDNLEPEETSFSLDFGDRITLPVTIHVPIDAQPGGFYSSVIISNEPQVNADRPQASTRVVSRVGTLFFVRVNGPVHEEGKVEDFRVRDAKSIYGSTPKEFQILFNNTGSVHLVPYGQIRITNMVGTEVGVLPVDAYFAMPDSLRYRNVSWEDSQFRIGRYTATLELHRGYGDTVDIKKISFWVIPLKVVIPVVGGIILLALIITLFLSRFEFRRRR